MPDTRHLKCFHHSGFLHWLQHTRQFLILGTHASFLSSSLAWILAAAGGSFASCVGLCCVCALLDLMLWCQQGGLPHRRKGLFLVNPACSPLVSCCVSYSGNSLLVVRLPLLPLGGASGQSPLACLAVLSALWLALIAFLPNPSAFLAAFNVWGVLVDVLVAVCWSCLPL